MLKSAKCIFAVGAFAAAAGLAAAPNVGFGMLDQLAKGEWTITSRGGAVPARKVCLGNPAQFVQLRHGTTACSHILIEESADKAIVQYRCKGNGYGITSLRRETASLVQINSQGIARGQPFQFQAEARRLGDCR